jgi:hypothetical protein
MPSALDAIGGIKGNPHDDGEKKLKRTFAKNLQNSGNRVALVGRATPHALGTRGCLMPRATPHALRVSHTSVHREGTKAAFAQEWWRHMAATVLGSTETGRVTRAASKTTIWSLVRRHTARDGGKEGRRDRGQEGRTDRCPYQEVG